MKSNYSIFVRVLFLQLLFVSYSCPVFGQQLSESESPPRHTLVEAVLTNKNANTTFDEINSTIRRRMDAWKALHVIYVMTVLSESGNGGEFIPKTECDFAYRGEKRLKHIVVPHGTEQEDSTIFSFDGRHEQQYKSLANRVSINDSPKQVYLDQDTYCHALGIGLTNEHRSTSLNSVEILPDMFDNPRFKWDVADYQYSVDGTDCHLLVESTTNHKIYVDVLSDCIPLLREFYVLSGDEPSQSTHVLLYQCNFRDWRRVQSILLPYVVSFVTCYPPSYPKENHGLPQIFGNISVSSLTINEDVDDSMFDQSKVPGRLVMDYVEKRKYRITETGEELDELLTHADQEVRKSGVRNGMVFLTSSFLVLLLILLISTKRVWQLRG